MAQKKILIIDDDVDLIEALQIPLESHGYEVVSRTDYQQAVEAVQVEKPDAILLDVMFPDHSAGGFEVCRELKDDPATKNIPLIILSAINEAFNMAFSASVKQGGSSSIPANEFLEKPVLPKVLLETLAKYL